MSDYDKRSNTHIIRRGDEEGRAEKAFGNMMAENSTLARDRNLKIHKAEHLHRVNPISSKTHT